LTPCLGRYTLAGKMSVIEMIREIEQKRVEQAAIEKAEKEAAATKERLQKEAYERQQKEKIEQRASFVAQQTRKILKESGVLDAFQGIENAILEKNYKYHDIVFNPRDAKATLIWSVYNIKVNEGQIYGEDYSFLVAEVDPDSETLTIRGKSEYRFNNTRWADKKAVEVSLATAFLNPSKYKNNNSDLEPTDDGVNGQDSGR
jgi:hypothetical protein